MLSRLNSLLVIPILFSLIASIFTVQFPLPQLDAFFLDRLSVLSSRLMDLTQSEIDEANLRFTEITFDEQSDALLGKKYPYQLQDHLEIMQFIFSARPKALFYFINLDMAYTSQDETLLNQIFELIVKAQKEQILFRLVTSLDPWGEVLPPATLRPLGYSLGLVHVDGVQYAKDGSLRRAVLSLDAKDTFHWWATQKLSPRFNNINQSTKPLRGSYFDSVTQATFVPLLLSHGLDYQTVGVHQILGRKIKSDILTNSVVMVGPAYISNPDDMTMVPSLTGNQVISKLRSHAVILNSLIHNHTILFISKAGLYAMVIFFSMFTSIMVMVLSPFRSSIGLVLILLSLLVFSILLLMIGYWLMLSSIVISILLSFYISIPFRALMDYQKRGKAEKETLFLRQVDHLKNNFLSLISHDLKTPIARIVSLVGNIRGEKSLSASSNQKLTLIENSAEELNKFLSSILNLNKIETHQVQINLISKDINLLIEEVCSELAFEIQNTGIELNVSLEPLYPIKIDPFLMKQVLKNLIENAIKYAASGKVLFISSKEIGEYIEIEIRDVGPGIAPEHLPHIFDKFYRVTTGTGTGLGLYLVKYFTELHGGKINCNSQLGVGTTFRLLLRNN